MYVFPMFFKSCVEVSVGSSYIKFVAVGATETSTQDLKNIGKTSDIQKANPNSLNMSLTKDMK